MTFTAAILPQAPARNGTSGEHRGRCGSALRGVSAARRRAAIEGLASPDPSQSCGRLGRLRRLRAAPEGPPDGSEKTAPRRRRSGRCDLRRYDRTTRSCASAAAPSRAPGRRADRCWPGADRSIRSRSMSDVPISRSALAPRSNRMACGGGSTLVCARICVRATLALKKYNGASRRRITRPGMGCASACRPMSPYSPLARLPRSRDVRPAGAIQQHHQRQQDRKRQARHDIAGRRRPPAR